MHISTEQLRLLVLQMIQKFPQGIHADFLLAAVYHASVADFTDLPDVMDHLTAEKLIHFSPAPDTPKLCTISPLGQAVLEELGSVVPEAALRAVEREYTSLMEGIDYSSSIQTKPNHAGAVFCCTAKKNGQVLSQISLTFEDEKNAYTAKQNFDKRPEEVLRAIGAVLTGKADFLLES